jgi:flagellar L-ring protein precursor FlgH
MKRTVSLIITFLFVVSVPAGAESLWENSQGAGINPTVSPGDLVTIQVSENAQGQTDNTREREKETEIGGQANADAPGATVFNEIASWIPLFGATISGESTYESERTAESLGSLTTTMTVQVAEVRADGLVVLRGKREVKIDDEIQNLKFEGKARAQDIRGDNTINSTRVADARISYEGKLGLAEGEARGWLDSGYLYVKNTLFW